MSSPRTIAVFALLLILVSPAMADAQPTPPKSEPQTQQKSQQKTQPAGPTPEEMELLRKATAADAADMPKRPGQAAPQPGSIQLPSVATTGGGVGGGAGVSSFRQQPLIGAMNPDISLILDVAAGWFSEDKNMQTGAHDPNRTGFTLQQLEMHIESAVDPYFELQANIVFSQFGVEVEEAYARSLSLPHGLQLRAGQFLARFGRQNPTHPHSWHFADQPILNGKFLGGEGLRGLGTEVSWLTPLPWYAEVVVSTQMGIGTCCARSFWNDRALPVRTPMDMAHLVRLQQFFPLDADWSVQWGLTAVTGPNGSGAGRWGTNRTELYGTDLYVRYRPVANQQRASLSWQTEAMLRRRQVPDRLLEDWGVTSQLVWRYALRWETGVRFEHVTGVSDDPLDEDWASARRRTTAQWTFYPSHFSRLRLQASVDMPTWRPKPIYAAFLALEVLIGAHGSHAF